MSKATLVKYHLDSTQVKLLTLTIALPYIVIWIVALLGYVRLNSYADGIKKDKDGIAFKKIAQGILWLTLWLPLSTIVENFFTQLYTDHPSMTANLVRLNNYLTLIILFIGFYIVFVGSEKLMAVVKDKNLLANQWVILGYITFSTLYVFLTLHDVTRSHPSRTVAVATYYEPDWLIVLTLIIPRLIYWFLGVQAVYNLYSYRRKVKGKLYRQALNYLTIGLAMVVVMTIGLRCLQSISSTLVSFSLGLLLTLVYLLLLLIAVGYVYIMLGARNLQKLEEL